MTKAVPRFWLNKFDSLKHSLKTLMNLNLNIILSELQQLDVLIPDVDQVFGLEGLPGIRFVLECDEGGAVEHPSGSSKHDQFGLDDVVVSEHVDKLMIVQIQRQVVHDQNSVSLSHLYVRKHVAHVADIALDEIITEEFSELLPRFLLDRDLGPRNSLVMKQTFHLGQIRLTVQNHVGLAAVLAINYRPQNTLVYKPDLGREDVYDVCSRDP